jgi:quercetin 2,3-dioxygenase
MVNLRKSEERGHFDYGWLQTRHTFSFNEYYDLDHMRFRSLRVINEDLVQPGAGFPTHGHRDMEIISYVMEGALEHKDSMGNGSTIKAGEVQRIRAGTGITHSEYNPSASETAHFLQIWITPQHKSLQPSYQQQRFDEAQKRGRLQLIASPEGEASSVSIDQDVELYACILDPSEIAVHTFRPGRHGWVQLLRGTLRANAVEMRAGDGAAVSEEPELQIAAVEPAEFLLFDMA